ncbi:hypothetical protein VFPBJ_01019 [Purpureocillium lilacinum]|uniref:Uncharacterized protein n=1 Tax=Purpureocillium lilacinum TaxID=33203 RepID=A0A179HBY9_PURLI|nr:hypothetical protein VFPBJ_01019 [Purpureocillium lilacinum]
MHARTSVRPCHRAVLVHTQSTDGLPATRTRRRVHDGQASYGGNVALFSGNLEPYLQ